MSRLPRGQDVLDSALQATVSATTIEQLRQAQAVVLPLQPEADYRIESAGGVPRANCVPLPTIT